MKNKILLKHCLSVFACFISTVLFSQTELIANGDFESGNSAFNTEYSYFPCQSTCTLLEGHYGIGTNASFFHSDWSGFDHTTGGGNFMIINGATSANVNVWCQTVNVAPANSYTFSCWITSVLPASPATLQFSVNGVSVGTSTAPSLAGMWKQFTVNWNSGPSNTATICIVNQNTASLGNDFGVDDISFIGICGRPNIFYRDADGDGFGDPNVINTVLVCSYPAPAGYATNFNDCDDTKKTYLDADGDGYGAGLPRECGVADNTDCNDNDAGIHAPITYYRDADGDGFGNVAFPINVCISTPPSGLVTDSTDCDDNRSDIHPGASELCDNRDNDCNGKIDDGIQVTYYPDRDDDGFGDANSSPLQSCVQSPPGYATNNSDCDDFDKTVYPGASEVCDAKDNDCNGKIDDGIQVTYYHDGDGDGFGDINSSPSQTCFPPPPDFVTNNSDCNDFDKTVYPGAPELCDNRDNDCNGLIDDGIQVTYYRDFDGDGYGNPNISVQSCSPQIGFVTNNTDCDDLDKTVYSGASEVCDGKDNDCNGKIDDGLQVTYYRDFDGDGYGNPDNASTVCGGQPPGYVTDNTDCNDFDRNTYPGAPEICDGRDNNCNGQIDENGQTTFYRDADGDGYGNANESTTGCTAPDGYVNNNTDCNDNDKIINPGTVWVLDKDNDGYYTGSPVTQCTSPGTGYVIKSTQQAGDCNDNTETVYPGAPEICDGLDNNCNGQIDEGVQTTFYRDVDGDGYGDPTNSKQSCSPPSGYVTNNTDCNDNDAAVHAPVQYYVDNDYDGYGSTTTAMLCSSTATSGYSTNNTDCNDNDASVHAPVQYYVDNDHDGYGSTTTAVLCSSTAPSGYSTNNTDCNDNDAAVHVPVQYYVDNDHDGYGSTTTAMLCSSTAPSGYSTNNTDCNDSDPTAHSLQTYYRDADGDGYGSSTTARFCSSVAPTGYSTKTGDCSDNDAGINPAAVEVCGNKIDDNCNGKIDEAGCAICTNATGLTTSGITTNSATLNWAATANPVQWQVQYKSTAPGAKWKDVLLSGYIRSVTISGLVANQSYNWHIRAKCGKTWTDYSGVISFKTLSSTQASSITQSTMTSKENSAAIKLYPNPSMGRFVIELHVTEKINATAKIQLIDMTGKTVQTENGNIEYGTLQKVVSISSSLAQGIYMVRVVVNNKTYLTRLIYEK